MGETGFQCFDNPNCLVSATATLPSSFLELFSYKKYSPGPIALAAGNYSIAFGVFDDAGSGAFDSGLLIDSVVVTDNPVNGVPEPGTMWLAAGGIGVLLSLRKR